MAEPDYSSYTDAELEAIASGDELAAYSDEELMAIAGESGGESALEVGADIAKTVLSTAVTEPLAGLSGLAISPFVGAEEGGQVVRNVQESLTHTPSTAGGADLLAQVSELVSPVTEAANSLTKLLGDQGALLAAGMGAGMKGEATGAAIAQTIPAAIASLLGARPVAAVGNAAQDAAVATAKVAGEAPKKAAEAVKNVATGQTPTKQRLGEKIAEGSTDSDVAKYMIEGQKVIGDPDAKSALRQGFSESIVSLAKGAGDSDKANMLKMLDAVEGGRKNALFEARNRPSNVLGESIQNRVKHVKSVKEQAGKQLDDVAQGLKREPFDRTAVGDKFLSDLGRMDIRVGPNRKLIFEGSVLEGKGKGITAAKNLINNVYKRMLDTKSTNAYGAHNLKRYIDAQVDFAKSQSGVAGQVDNLLKDLRKDVNDRLRADHPEYKRVNQIYSDTVGALNELQDIAGRKTNLLGPNGDQSLGTLSRRLLSNTVSGPRLTDALDDLSSVANRYGGNFDDDIMSQVLFFDELNRLMPPNNSTTFRGEIGKEIPRTAKGGIKDRVIDAAASKVDDLLFNEERAIAAMRKLLQRQSAQQPRTAPPQRLSGPQ